MFLQRKTKNDFWIIMTLIHAFIQIMLLSILQGDSSVLISVNILLSKTDTELLLAAFYSYIDRQLDTADYVQLLSN